MLHHPKLTLLISTYNDRDLVEKKIAEVEKQHAFEEVEFIFIETASPELERELIAPFCDKHENCKLLSRDERLTLYEAWNLGWSKAKAPIVAISNMDDTMHPRLLEFVIREMNRNDWDISTVLIAKQQSSDSEVNDWTKARISKLPLQERLGAFFCWKKNLIHSLGAFDTKFILRADKDFWARANHAKLSMGLIPYILYLYTKHENQLSKKTNFRQLKDKESAYGDSKPYPFVWPKEITRKIKKKQLTRKIPLMKNESEIVDIVTPL